MSKEKQAWENYGDKSLSEGWTLVLSDEKANGEAFKGCYYILRTYFDYDKGQYVLEDTYVDVNDSWIERKEVMNYIGMTEETYDEVRYAIGCLDYYGYMNFGCDILDYFDTIEELEAELKSRGVDVERIGG